MKLSKFYDKKFVLRWKSEILFIFSFVSRFEKQLTSLYLQLGKFSLLLVSCPERLFSWHKNIFRLGSILECSDISGIYFLTTGIYFLSLRFS